MSLKLQNPENFIKNFKTALKEDDKKDAEEKKNVEEKKQA